MLWLKILLTAVNIYVVFDIYFRCKRLERHYLMHENEMRSYHLTDKERLTSIFEHLRNTEKSIGHVMETSTNIERIALNYIQDMDKAVAKQKKKPSK